MTITQIHLNGVPLQVYTNSLKEIRLLQKCIVSMFSYIYYFQLFTDLNLLQFNGTTNLLLLNIYRGSYHRMQLSYKRKKMNSKMLVMISVFIKKKRQKSNRTAKEMMFSLKLLCIFRPYTKTNYHKYSVLEIGKEKEMRRLITTTENN